MKELVTFRKYLNEGVINEDELDDLLDSGLSYKEIKAKHKDKLRAANIAYLDGDEGDKDGVVNEGKSPKDVFKIAITNLLSNSPSKISEDDWRAEYLRIHGLEGEEFIDLSTRQWGELNYYLDWFAYHYNKGIYKEVDEFLNNYPDLS